MSNETNNKIVFNYLSRSEVIGKEVRDTLNYLYSLARPVMDKPFLEICKEMEEERKACGGDENWRKTYCDGKYMYPYDFYYLPAEVTKAVRVNRQEAYGISTHWDDAMTHLIEILYNGGGIREVHTPTEWSNGENVRHCIDVETIDKIIGEEAAEKLKDVLEGYKHTYRWGLRDVNQFVWLCWAEPSTNRELVKNAWKDAFGIDVEIPDDSEWVDIYYDDNYPEDVVDDEEELNAPEEASE